MAVVCTISSGSDVEGIVIDDDMVANMWPGMSNAQILDRLRDVLKLELILMRAACKGEALSNATSYVSQHVTDTQ